ncbi:hypothetical protein [Desulfofundulus salinus]|uniref:Uncharacterized protein n=1 Tax=Desulfofundulus salinus TaxID=2419843 RepID=A0A494WUK1_9FIRM|nr:hypothetical protein [Desulfofundulus salinum]RKO66533.1 hypothetical protein D7024_05935 [Desulfofundulus salinum]
MPWVISFAISWLVFFALADRRRYMPLLVGGLAAVIVQLLTDNMGHYLNLYRISDPVLPIFYSSAFFTFGPVFTMGALFGQYLPSLRWLQGLHIMAFSGLFLLEERMFMLAGVLVYTHWDHFASLLVNTLVFTGLAWLVESQRVGWGSPG